MADLTGKILNRQYELRKLVASGGTADLYCAWDPRRNTEMAIKVLRADLASSNQFIQVFEKEAKTLRDLDHPNIVRIYEFHKTDGHVYIVMDWIAGENLRQRILRNKSPLPTEEISRILNPLLAALHFAHEMKKFHCDVKSPNVLLSHTGGVFLSDFGIARTEKEIEFSGTPAYMAPEQFRKGQVDQRTDIYALGILLYEMLSGGILPFRGETPNANGNTTRDRIEWEHHYLPVPPLRAYNPNITTAVEQVVLTAMIKDPEKRFRSVKMLGKAFNNALISFSGGKTEETRVLPAPAETQFWKNPPALFNPTPNPKVNPGTPSTPRPILPKGKGPYLIGLFGDFKNHSIPLPQHGRFVLGRGTNASLHFSDPSVSREHALIVIGNRGIYINDLGSKSGTFLGNNRIGTQPVQIRAGTQIRLGQTQVFELRS